MLFRRNRNARQLDDELRFHLDQQIAENIASGPPEEARYAAMRAFGNPTVLKEETRYLGLDLGEFRRTTGMALVSVGVLLLAAA